MKLTFICGFAWDPKGTVRSRAFPLAEEMVRRGHEGTLIIVPYDNLAHSGERFTKSGVRVINVGIKKGIGSLARASYELIREIDKSRPELVHVFKPKGFAGLAAMWLLLRNRPFVVDCDDWEGWGGWNEVKNYPWLVKEFIDFQEKHLLRRSPAVTVASRALFDRAVSFRKTASQLFYVPNGPTSEQLELSARLVQEDSEFYKENFGLRGAPLILYAGNFDPADDVMFFCRSLLQLKPRKSFNVAFAGEGPELPNVRSFFAAHPDIHLSFLGRLASPKYAELVAASDVCAFPYPDTAVYHAKCSARIIDFMLHGKAVASTSVGQNFEYIVNEESGLLTSPRNEAEFAYTLTRLIEDEDLRHRLGANARRRILQKFLWSGRAGDDCERVYRGLGLSQRVAVVRLASQPNSHRP